MEYNRFEAVYFDSLQRNGLSQYAKTRFAEQFYRLTALLTEANARMNLTAIRNPFDMIPLHYTDSLFAASYLPANATLLDCGCGAGFPSLPLAIVRPDVKITALDSTAKKLGFVDTCAKELGLSNLRILCGRAEELARDRRYRERFDACTARAVASLPVLAELCVPFLSRGGVFVALKGAKAEKELLEAAHALPLLGCSSPKAELYRLIRLKQTDPDKNNDKGLGAEKDGTGVNVEHNTKSIAGNKQTGLLGGDSPLGVGYESLEAIAEDRGIIFAKKCAPTPDAYPRKYAVIQKKPL